MRDWTSTTLEVNPTSVMKLFLVRKKSQIKEEKMLLLKYCPVGTVGLLTRFTCARLIRSPVEDDLSRQHFRGGRWRAPRVGEAGGGVGWVGGLDSTMFYWGETSCFSSLWFPTRSPHPRQKPLRPLCSLSTVIDLFIFSPH